MIGPIQQPRAPQNTTTPPAKNSTNSTFPSSPSSSNTSSTNSSTSSGSGGYKPPTSTNSSTNTTTQPSGGSTSSSNSTNSTGQSGSSGKNGTGSTSSGSSTSSSSSNGTKIPSGQNSTSSGQPSTSSGSGGQGTSGSSGSSGQPQNMPSLSNYTTTFNGQVETIANPQCVKSDIQMIPGVNISFYYEIKSEQKLLFVNSVLSEQNGNFRLNVKHPTIVGSYIGILVLTKPQFVENSVVITIQVNPNDQNQQVNVGTLQLMSFNGPPPCSKSL